MSEKVHNAWFVVSKERHGYGLWTVLEFTYINEPSKSNVYVLSRMNSALSINYNHMIDLQACDRYLEYFKKKCRRLRIDSVLVDLT